MEEKCIKCNGSIHIPEQDIERDIQRVIESGVPLANDKLYKKRLDLCISCEQLMDGTTCRICGCIVRVRAMNALRICPDSAGNKW